MDGWMDGWMAAGYTAYHSIACSTLNRHNRLIHCAQNCAGCVNSNNVNYRALHSGRIICLTDIAYKEDVCLGFLV